jgi:hypothetical protein
MTVGRVGVSPAGVPAAAIAAAYVVASGKGDMGTAGV